MLTHRTCAKHAVHVGTKPKKSKLTMSSDDTGSFYSSFKLDSCDFNDNFCDNMRIAILFSPTAWGRLRASSSTHCAVERRRQAPVITSVKTMIVGHRFVEKGASYVTSGSGDRVAYNVTNTGWPVKGVNIRWHESGTHNKPLKFIFRKTSWLAVISFGTENRSVKENIYVQIFVNVIGHWSITGVTR